MSGAYYNENDPFAAAWSRELIKQGLIADGEVDERSIEDVRPEDLKGFTQCHFFSGIGGWSLALRLTGVPDDFPAWTGSCPCQPFSAAGKGGGFDDERHLWPAWHWLIGECRPELVFGEQVASKPGLAWLDLVSADLEGSGYAFGAFDLSAAGVGAPHIRQRLYWVADADRGERGGVAKFRGLERDGQDAGWSQGGGEHGARRNTDRLAHSDERGQPRPGIMGRPGDTAAQADREVDRVVDDGGGGGMADAGGTEPRRLPSVGWKTIPADGIGGKTGRDDKWPGPADGFWRNADWLFCRDGKWRPVEPGTFPLATGLPARVGRLRGYGNAIVAPLAAEFVKAYLG